MTPTPPPYALLAELTHRCPLQCLYCSNPLDLVETADELSGADWLRLLEEAAALGVLQVHLSGGEPLLRDDVELLAAEARRLGIFTNLITSGVGLTARRAADLAAAGLNSVQLSVQGVDLDATRLIAKAPAFDRKRAAAVAVHASGLPLNMNVVLHRLNLDTLERIVDLCVDWGAIRLELANTQYYGWGLKNRARLLPTREQLTRAEAVFDRKRAELAGQVELLWIVPDYYDDRPKACMNGWAAQSMTVAPDGTAYPCPVAADMDLAFPSVREHDLAWIWNESRAFNAYRGTDWMSEPCQTCEFREADFGGCRCQAFALTGDAARTDPVCSLSPDHHLVTVAVTAANEHAAEKLVPLTYRRLAKVPRP